MRRIMLLLVSAAVGLILASDPPCRCLLRREAGTRSRYATTQVSQDEDVLSDGKRMRLAMFRKGKGTTPRLVSPQLPTGLGSRSGARALLTTRISAAHTLTGTYPYRYRHAQ
jgi:hypothetical protein